MFYYFFNHHLKVYVRIVCMVNRWGKYIFLLQPRCVNIRIKISSQNFLFSYIFYVYLKIARTTMCSNSQLYCSNSEVMMQITWTVIKALPPWILILVMRKMMYLKNKKLDGRFKKVLCDTHNIKLARYEAQSVGCNTSSKYRSLRIANGKLWFKTERKPRIVLVSYPDP